MIQVVDHDLDLSYLRNGYADFINRWSPQEKPEFRDGRFHASGLGLCARRAVLKRALYEGRPYTEEHRAMFAEANFIHAGMTKYWIASGTAIAREERFSDLPVEMRATDEEQRLLMSPFPGWTGKFDALAHRPEWCGCKVPSKELGLVWQRMVQLYNRQDPSWERYRDDLREHIIVPVSLKTVHPNGLHHCADGPKLHHVWQDSWYVAAANRAYGFDWRHVCIMYRGRGGGGQPFFHMVEALDPTNIMLSYDMDWVAFEEMQQLPSVLEHEVAVEKDKTWGEILTISVPWECGYCDYANWTNEDSGFRCEPVQTKNVTRDRIGLLRDGVAHLIESWYQKGGYDEQYLVRLTESMLNRESMDCRVEMAVTERPFK